MNKYILYTLSLIFLICTNISCSDDDGGPKISFERSLYILTAFSPLDVKLILSEASDQEIRVPFVMTGTAVLDEDFTISSTEFVFAPGEMAAKITITPKDNLIEGQNIRLDITPPAGYSGDKLFTLIPVEAKEHLVYSFKTSAGRLLGELDIYVTIVGELSGSSFRASSDIDIPFVITDESTAVEGVHYTIKGNKNHVTIKKGEWNSFINLQFLDLPDNESKELYIELQQPELGSEYYIPGAFKRFKCTVSKLQFSDLYGKWKPNKVTSKDVYIMLDLDESEYSSLPEKNGPDDYLEFTNVDGVDVIIPHLTGDLKTFFSGTSHAVTFTQIKSFLDFATWAEYDLPYFKVSNVNRAFSKKVNTPGDAEIALTSDPNGLLLYFHDYIPTDFFSATYEMWGGFDPELMGITYSFTKIEEE